MDHVPPPESDRTLRLRATLRRRLAGRLHQAVADSVVESEAFGGALRTEDLVDEVLDHARVVVRTVRR